jgi:hypothetical protein
VRLEWEATERVSAGLQFANLTDHRYREHGSGIDAPGFGCIATLELRL